MSSMPEVDQGGRHMSFDRAAVLRVLVALTVLVAATFPATAGATDRVEDDPVTSAPIVDGQYLVQLADPPPDGRVMGLPAEHIGFGIYLISEASSGTVLASERAGRDASARAGELSALLGRQVVPNRVSRLLVDNPEPDATSQWPLDNFAQFAGGVVDADIDGEEAWDVSTGDGIVVAVIDSGADMDHPDLADNVWVNTGEIGGNGIDDDGNGFVDDVNGWDFFGTLMPDDSHIEDADPDDPGAGHGTAVAGIIAAPFNGAGIAGVAPDSEIMVLRACGLLLCPDDTVIKAIYYAANNGADVINLSLGRAAGEHTAMEIAVQNAIDQGIVVVAAAGNDGTDNDTDPIVPASLGIPGLLAVAMTDHADELDPGSNFGHTSVHLGAPGVGIWTLTTGAGYGFWDGTSFASPTTAGVAALLADHQSCLNPVQIASVIETSGDPIAALAGKTISGKRLNAFRALDVDAVKNGIVALPAPAPVSFFGGGAGTTWTFGDGDSAMGSSARHVYEMGWFVADDGTDTYEVASGLDFADTCANKFKSEILWMSASGITLGCDATPNYCPEVILNRAQMASLLARALDLPPATDDYFTDDEGLSHEDNINRLAESGVTLGCGPGLFCPLDDLIRAQMATFLVRAFALPPSATDWFSDDDGLSHEANINALAEAGITLGCAEGLFCPVGELERDEMAAFIFRGRSYLP